MVWSAVDLIQISESHPALLDKIFISVSVRCTENGTMQPALSTERAETSLWQCPGGCTLHSQHLRRQRNWAMKKSLSTIFTWLLSNQLLLSHLSNCLQDKYFCSWENAGSTSNSPSNLEVRIQIFLKLHFLLWVVCMGVTCVVLPTQFYNKISGTFIISRANLTLMSYKYRISTRSSAKPVGRWFAFEHWWAQTCDVCYFTFITLFICLLEFLYESRDCPLQ